MSNQTPNSDPVFEDDPPSAEDPTAPADDNLVQSVLADARELLETLEGGNAEDEVDSPESSLPVAEKAFDPDSVAAVLDRVEHLVDDFDHLDDAVEDQPRSEAFDLTAVASKPPPSPDERVPSHGPNGPEVDLFAAEPVVEPSTEPPMNPALGFEMAVEEEDPVSEAGPPPPISATSEPPMPGTPEEESESSEDAAVRLEQLLADRLAEEYDVVEDLVQQQPVAQEAADEGTPEAETVVNEAMIDSNEPAVRTEFESIEPTDHELGLSSTRVIPASEVQPVEMASIPGEPEPSQPAAMSTIKDDVGGPETAVMDRVEAEASTDPVDPGESEASGPIEASTNEVSTAPSELEDGAADEDPEGDQPSTEAENGSVLLSIATLPYRILPESFHRFVTPLALSLAIWVPITWTFAVVDPQPSSAAMETLQPGFEGQDAEERSRTSDEVGGEEKPG
jgi:hypothetical protein